MNVAVKLIMDRAVAFYMEFVDIVLVGAEAVVESGGIINKARVAPLAARPCGALSHVACRCLTTPL